MPARKPKTAAKADPQPEPETIIESVKGFDRDLKCRGFQFEIGKTYEHRGPVVACVSGFHAISGHPLEVFNYYPPSSSRYTAAQQFGALKHHSEDSKIASAKITIGVEISLGDLTQRAVKWVFDRANWKDGPAATGENEGATASGWQGAATASGTQGAATASGWQGAATASGDRGAATASGTQGRVKGAHGNALFLVYRDPNDGKILHAWAGIVGRDGTKADVWYQLGADGQPAEVM
jgi:hypothetical protein